MVVPMMEEISGFGWTRVDPGLVPGEVVVGEEETMVDEIEIMEIGEEVVEAEIEVTPGRGIAGEGAEAGLTHERKGGREAGVTPGAEGTGVAARTSPGQGQGPGAGAECITKIIKIINTVTVHITEKILYSKFALK